MLFKKGIILVVGIYFLYWALLIAFPIFFGIIQPKISIYFLFIYNWTGPGAGTSFNECYINTEKKKKIFFDLNIF